MELSLSYNHKMSKKARKQEIHSVDILTNILNRLPSISIVRFQVVSKYWCYVIHSSGILNARAKSSLTSIQLFTNIVSSKITLFNFDNEGKTKINNRYINLGNTTNFNFSNTVNGLACAYGSNATTTFYLINLTTFETSKHKKRKLKQTSLSYDKITLGFDPSSGVYKFIRIYSYSKSGNNYRCEILEIGVLFSGKWKLIGEIPHDVDLDNPIFLNGTVHWKVKPSPLSIGKSLSFDFLELDMKKERFNMVAPALQNEIDDGKFEVCNCNCGFTLSEDDGKLFVLHYCCLRQCLYGWRLKETMRYRIWNVAFHVNFALMIEKEAHCLLGYIQKPYAAGIVDGKVLIRSKRYAEGLYIYDLLHEKLYKKWDVYDVAVFVKSMG